jgi:hypothetical protein
MAVLKKMYAMGPSTLVLYGMSVKDIFYKPVSTTFPGIAQSYYSVIKQPMTLGQIEDKLNRGRYSSPAQFAQVGGMLLVRRGRRGLAECRCLLLVSCVLHTCPCGLWPHSSGVCFSSSSSSAKLPAYCFAARRREVGTH